MIKTPLVSVVIPTHNRAVLVQRAIESVLTQSYTELECIVVDDGSTDGTDAALEAIDDPRFVYLRHDRPRGASAARNTGIGKASGPLIAFLDDDDIWLPDKLAKQVPVLLAAPERVGLVYCWMDYVDDTGTVCHQHHPTHRGYVFPLVLDQQRIGGCPTLLVRRNVVDAVGGFNENIPRGNDGDFIRRICLRYEVDLVPEVLVRVHARHGFDRISDNDIKGLRNAIKGHRAKLTAFRDELPGYPKQAAAIYTAIARHYEMIGKRRASRLYYLRALSIQPFGHRVPWAMLRSLLHRAGKPRLGHR